MSDELIRKLDVIEIMENLIYDMSEVSTIPQLAKSAIEKLEPVNAVELPCKVGDTIFTIYGGVISESIVKRITIYKDCCLLRIKDFRLDKDFMIEEWDIDPNTKKNSKYTFFTREEAEKALEELKNE